MTEDNHTEITGLNLTIEQYDSLQFSFVKKEWSEFEVSLFKTKWFDYRFMHPVQATYLFKHEFIKAYRNAFKKNFDSKAAEHIRPLKKDDLFECSKNIISGMWRARQHADAMGMPYDVYLELAFKTAMLYWNRTHMPRPQQLYSQIICDRLPGLWEELQSANVFYSHIEEYKLEEFSNTDAQNAHHQWLLDQAGKRFNPESLLIRFSKESLLPLDKIEDRFGKDVAKKVEIEIGG